MKIIAIILVLLLLYLLAIMPRLCNRPDYKPFYGRMYAHRGLHNMNPSLREANSPYCNGGNYPENSYAAIKRAVEQGFGIEFDVHLTKDGIPVVFHDDTLLRICGVDGNLPLGIEYKVEKNANALCSTCDKILSDYKGLYCIESFHPLALLWYRRNRPDIVRGQLSENFMKTTPNVLFFFLAHLIFNFIASPDFIAYNCKHYTELSRTLCRKLYRCLSIAWTVRSQDELEQIAPHFDSFIFEDFIPKV